MISTTNLVRRKNKRVFNQMVGALAQPTQKKKKKEAPVNPAVIPRNHRRGSEDFAPFSNCCSSRKEEGRVSAYKRRRSPSSYKRRGIDRPHLSSLNQHGGKKKTPARTVRRGRQAPDRKSTLAPDLTGGSSLKRKSAIPLPSVPFENPSKSTIRFRIDGGPGRQSNRRCSRPMESRAGGKKDPPTSAIQRSRPIEKPGSLPTLIKGEKGGRTLRSEKEKKRKWPSG